MWRNYDVIIIKQSDWYALRCVRHVFLLRKGRAARLLKTVHAHLKLSPSFSCAWLCSLILVKVKRVLPAGINLSVKVKQALQAGTEVLGYGIQGRWVKGITACIPHYRHGSYIEEAALFVMALLYTMSHLVDVYAVQQLVQANLEALFTNCREHTRKRFSRVTGVFRFCYEVTHHIVDRTLSETFRLLFCNLCNCLP